MQVWFAVSSTHSPTYHSYKPCLRGQRQDRGAITMSASMLFAKVKCHGECFTISGFGLNRWEVARCCL